MYHKAYSVIQGQFGKAVNVTGGDILALIAPDDPALGGLYHSMSKDWERVHPIKDVNELLQMRLGHGSPDNLWAPGTSKKLGFILLDRGRVKTPVTRCAIEEALYSDFPPVDTVLYARGGIISEDNGEIFCGDLLGDIPGTLTMPSEPLADACNLNNLMFYSVSSTSYPDHKKSGRRMIETLYSLLHDQPIVLSTGTPCFGFKEWLVGNNLTKDNSEETLRRHALHFALAAGYEAYKFHSNMGASIGKVTLAPDNLDLSAISFFYHKAPERLQEQRASYKQGLPSVADYLVEEALTRDERQNVLPVSSRVSLYDEVFCYG